jgi:hypothetical protein
MMLHVHPAPEVRVDPDLAALIPETSLAAWGADSSVIHAIWPDGRLAFFNAAWNRFAIENGAPALRDTWPLGRSLWDAVPQILLPFYRAHFAESLAQLRLFQHDYECSSPTHRRTFHLRASPIADGAALLLVHALSREDLHAERLDAAEAEYLDADGIATQCAHCRRVRTPDGADRWDFVPAYVAHQRLNISHGLCGPCLELYYPPRR